MPFVRAHVYLASRVIQRMQVEADAKYDRETGGVLLGKSCGPNCTSIKHAVGPGPAALHEKDSFHPDHEWQLDEIRRIFRASNGTLVYQGEWHTHPFGASWPSKRDLTTAKHISRYKPARMKNPMMIILSGSFSHWSIACFQYRRGQLRSIDWG